MATGTAPTTTAPGSDIVDQLEKYISEHDVESMVKTMMRDCFQSKPKDPAAFW